MRAPFPCHPIPSVAAEIEADAALTARACRLGIGVADTLPAPLHDPRPIQSARLVEVAPGATVPAQMAPMYAPDVIQALKALRLEAYWMARQLEARGLKGVPGDSVDRAMAAADAIIARADPQP